MSVPRASFTRLVRVGFACAGMLALGLAPANGQSERPPEANAVLGVHATGTAIIFRVPSGGCTSAADFEMQSSRNGDVATLLLIRKSPDNCKGFFPQGEDIAFSYEQLGIERGETIQIDNPVAWTLMPPR